MSQGATLARQTGEGREAAGPGAVYILATVSLGAILAPLNSTMLAVALPVIRRELDVSHAAVGWLVSSYLIAMAVTQPVGGRLGDQLGRARVFRAGLAAFLVFSLASAAAPNFLSLLVFRTLQAVSGAILIPNGMGMLREAVPAARFGRFSGFNSAIVGGTAAAGPVLGGAIIAIGPWRWMFLANVPVVIAALALSTRLAGRGGSPGARARVDWLGVALFAGVLFLVTALLNDLRGDNPALAAGGFAGLAVVGALFAWRQARTTAPAAEWRLFRERSFVGASSHILLMNLAMYTTLLAVPFFLTDVQHRSSTAAGLLLGCMAALQAIIAPFAGGFGDSVGRRAVTLASSLVALVGTVVLTAGISTDMPLPFLAGVMLVLGGGVGMGFVSAATAAIEAAPRALSASAAGTQSMMRYFGSIVGAGVLSGLLDTHGAAPGIGTFRLLFLVVTVMVALSLPMALLVRPFAADSRTSES